MDLNINVFHSSMKNTHLFCNATVQLGISEADLITGCIPFCTLE